MFRKPVMTIFVIRMNVFHSIVKFHITTGASVDEISDAAIDNKCVIVSVYSTVLL